MKMKTLCEKTGLSERTIRFYIEKGLLVPAMQPKNGRTVFQFSQQDQVMLNRIAALRKAEFSVRDILCMQKKPEQITAIVQAQASRLQSKEVHCREVVALLEKIGPVQDFAMLADRLQQSTAVFSLPLSDLTPNFGRFDLETREEKKAASQAFEEKEKRSYQRGRAIVMGIAIINAVLAIGSACLQFNLFSLCFQLVLSLLLLAGVSWARLLLLVGNGFTVCLLAATIFEIGFATLPPNLLLLLLIQFLYALFCCITLWKSRAVNEYLETQREK